MRKEIYRRDKGICWVCHDFVDYEVDYDIGHIIDKSNGGEYELINLTVMHHKCNLSKPRHKTIEEAVKWQLTNRFKQMLLRQDQPIINTMPNWSEINGQPQNNYYRASPINTTSIIPITQNRKAKEAPKKPQSFHKTGIPQIEIIDELAHAKTIITWRQGSRWMAIIPPYDKIYPLLFPLPNAKTTFSGKGSVQKSIQILGEKPNTDLSIQLNYGWATISIFYQIKSGELLIKHSGGKEAINRRWDKQSLGRQIQYLSYIPAIIPATLK